MLFKLTLFYLIYLFSLKRTNTLYCGLFGYSGSEPPNMGFIRILGMYNIARGTDSCGIMIDNKLYKGIGTESNFVNFLEKNPLPEPKDDNIIIGHTRKATTGAHTEENAHPFMFLLDKKPYFIGAHNGVINNTDTICKKYGMDEKDYNVDSQILLNVIADMKQKQNNIEVFKDYKGAAALLFRWINEPNTLYAFHGKSLVNTWSNVETEERPLFYYKIRGKDQIYLSSIKESLLCIGGTEDTVKEVEHNKIYKFTNGKVAILKYDVDRSKVVNSENFTTGTRNITTASSASNNNNKGLSNYHERHRVYCETTFSEYPKDAIERIPYKEITFESKLLRGMLSSATRKTIGNVNTIIPTVLLDLEPMIGQINEYRGKVYFWRGHYYRNGHVLGRLKVESIVVDLNGYPENHEKHDPNYSVREYFFFNGNMLKDAESARIFEELVEKNVIWPSYITEREKTENLKFAIQDYQYDLFDNLIVTTKYDSLGVAKMRNIDGKYSMTANGIYIPHFYRGIAYEYKTGWFFKAEYDCNYIEMVSKSRTMGEYLREKNNNKSKKTMNHQELNNILNECYSVKSNVVLVLNKLEEVSPEDLEETKTLKKFKKAFTEVSKYLREMIHHNGDEEEVGLLIEDKKVF